MDSKLLPRLARFVAEAVKRDTAISVSVFPRTIPDQTALWSKAEDIGYPDAHPEYLTGDGYRWWTMRLPGLTLTVHEASEPDTGPAPYTGTANPIDRSLPYEMPVTVAATPSRAKADDAGWE
jgi:hypothetical protein